jgi:phosphatidylglycerol:prolipoprotein diacylglycerol transferase
LDLNNVSFPGLGLDFEIRRYAFSVFGLEIYWYGIIIAFAFLLAVLLAVKSCRKYDLVPDNILDLVLFAAPTAIVFARLFYVVFSWDQYRYNLVDIIKIRDGGLAIYGGVIGALLVAWLYAKKKKITFLHLADFGIPYLVLGQGIGRWGNFVNQEAFGSATMLPWRMNGTIVNGYLLDTMPAADLSVWGVHPTFLYESLFDIAIFLFLANYRKKKKVEGEVLFLYLMLYGFGRAFIEGLRTDSLYLGSFKVSQLLSVVLLVLGLLLFVYRRVKAKNAEDAEPVELGQSRYGSLLMKMKEEEETEKNIAAEAVDEAGETGAEIVGEAKTETEAVTDDTATTEAETETDEAKKEEAEAVNNDTETTEAGTETAE